MTWGVGKMLVLAGILVAAIGLAVFTLSQVAGSRASISGIVRDENGPVAGATVRIQGKTAQTLTDDQGRFTLDGLAEGIGAIGQASPVS